MSLTIGRFREMQPDGNFLYAEICNEEGDTVCTVPFEIKDLVAAAPDLLEALQQLSQLGHKGMEPNPDEWLCLHDKVAQIADVAIAKATGKS